MITLLGYLLAVGIGLLLGLIGGGGSILTVPILVYLLKIPATLATSYSLFIVGTTALIGCIQQMLRGNVAYTAGILFGFPSVIGVYISRKWLLPLIPDLIFSEYSFSLSKDTILIVLFAVLMITSSLSMIYKKSPPKIIEKKPHLVVFEGLVVGVFTGLIGAGGGFLVIPALVNWVGLDMKVAVGTSLLIIALKSLIGFIGDLQRDVQMNWELLLFFSGCAFTGILIGSYFNKRFSTNLLKQVFGWFVLVVGVVMIVAELAGRLAAI